MTQVRWPQLRLSLLGLSALLAVASGVVSAQNTSAAPSATRGDDAFLAAADAFRTRNRAKFQQVAPGTSGHVLEPYVRAWGYQLALDEADPIELREFLNRYPRTPFADRLRADWIRLLARRADWPTVRELAPQMVDDSPDITCWSLQARWRLKDESALTEVRAVWEQPRAIPEGCQPLIDQLVRSGDLKQNDIWQRGRALLENGQLPAASATFDLLPPAEQPDPKWLAQLNTQPAKFIDRAKLDLAKRANREAAIFAIARIARSQPHEAHAVLQALPAAKLTAEERAYAFAQIGLYAARSHMPEAVGWFRESHSIDVSEEHLAWRTRAALREGNWAETRAAIEKMGATQKADPTWIYWLGRALREDKRVDEANALFAKIAGQPHFYGGLAQEDLAQPFVVPPKAYTPTADELAAVQKDPGIQRALALLRLDMRGDAVKDWWWSTRGWDDKRLLAVSEIGRRVELWDRAINTSERTVAVHDYGLRFLAPYRPQFAEAAKSQNVDEAWVLGLVRQESRFIVNARSSAGASGLMQLMPATARMVAKRVGMKEFRWANVTDPEVNITLGTSYMRQVLDGLENHPVLASAGYNAGPGRAERWRGPRPLEGAIYAESIPFNETRDYVKRVMSNAMYYAALLGLEQKTLRERMGTIPARNGATVTASQ